MELAVRGWFERQAVSHGQAVLRGALAEQQRACEHPDALPAQVRVGGGWVGHARARRQLDVNQLQLRAWRRRRMTDVARRRVAPCRSRVTAQDTAGHATAVRIPS